MQAVLNGTLARRGDGQQILLCNSKILTRRGINIVFRVAARHERVERIVAAKHENADERPIVGEHATSTHCLRVCETRRRSKKRCSAAGLEKVPSV